MNRDIQDITQKIVQQGYIHIEQRNRLEHMGFDLMSEIGTDRVVFATGVETVVKIARNESTVEANYDESAVWNKFQDMNRGVRDTDLIFCPVIDSGPHYTWIEMDLCHRTPSRIAEFETKLDNTSWKIQDVHADNIGVHPDTESLVCYDYPDAKYVE